MFKTGISDKALRTRAHILETALRLFKRDGYDGTTMRAISREAGVSLGNAYYYFKSKEHLIQGFYDRTHREHLSAALPVLDAERDLKKRLHGVLAAKLETIEPYHRFSGILFKTAADPESPLNPFSPDSEPVRREATAVFEQVITGARQNVHPSLAAELPNLLWIYHMGIILFWIHDRSPGRARSYQLVTVSVELVAQLIRLANLPVIRPLVRKTLKMLQVLNADTGLSPSPA